MCSENELKRRIYSRKNSRTNRRIKTKRNNKQDRSREYQYRQITRIHEIRFMARIEKCKRNP